MATLIAVDITRPSERDAYWAKVVAANKRLYSLGYIRRDFLPFPDGMQRFKQAIARMEK